MNPTIRSAALLLVLAACGPAPVSTPTPVETGTDAAAATITSGDLLERIGFLASDELRGRDTPSPGLEAAAEYIASEFERLGLDPAGENGTYLQRYPYTRVALAPASASLTIDGPGDDPALAYPTDFLVLPSERDAASGAPAFIGGLSRVLTDLPTGLTGRVAVAVMDGPPGPAFIRAPAAVAEAGALALIIVFPPQVGADVMRQIASQAAVGAVGRPPVPTFGVRWDVATSLFSAAGQDLGTLAQAAPPAEAAVLANTTLNMVARSEFERAMVPNVAAVLRGSDPALRDEYVLITAHFDHVGVGAPDASGDSIYNGADDDASGTAVVLEAAEAFAALGEAPARSVLFLLVSGEEKGLLGARHYADNPTVPIANVVANINMDMVGRGAPDTLVAIGQEYTSLGPLAHEVSAASDDVRLTIIRDPDPSQNAFFRSDHVAFVRKEIPAIFFSTWLHEDYHRPSDEVERIDGPKIARVGRLVFRLAHDVADTPARPVWLPGGLEQVRELLRQSPF